MTPPLAHTPEPWYLAERYGELEIYGPEAHTFRQIIARIHHTAGARNEDPSTDLVAMANAKLFVAAPRLLRILGRLASCIKIPAAEDQHTPLFARPDVEVESALIQALQVLTDLHLTRDQQPPWLGWPLTSHQDPELMPWLFGIANNKPNQASDFLKSIVDAALRADFENYPLLRPVLLELKKKYPKYSDPDAHLGGVE